MVRFLIFLVGMLTTNRPGGARTVPMWQGDSHGSAESAELHAEGPDDGGTWFHPAQPLLPPPQWPYREAGRAPVQAGSRERPEEPAAAHPAQAHVGCGPGRGRRCSVR